MGAPADCPTELRLLNTVDCHTLRDMLFAMRFVTEELPILNSAQSQTERA